MFLSVTSLNNLFFLSSWSSHQHYSLSSSSHPSNGLLPHICLVVLTDVKHLSLCLIRVYKLRSAIYYSFFKAPKQDIETLFVKRSYYSPLDRTVSSTCCRHSFWRQQSYWSKNELLLPCCKQPEITNNNINDKLIMLVFLCDKWLKAGMWTVWKTSKRF